MVKVAQNKAMVQIGTNDGADEFNTIARYVNPSKVILIEPNLSLNGQILENYKGIKNVFIENVAITEMNKGKVTLVIPANHGNYTHVQYSLLPMDDWGEDFNEINAQSMTFAELCKKYEITEIGYLQIDTEGYDAEIIKSIDFTKVHIDIIKYEDWSFKEECFSRHGEKAKQYGVNGMVAVDYLLKNLGYIIEKEKRDYIAVKE